MSDSDVRRFQKARIMVGASLAVSLTGVLWMAVPSSANAAKAATGAKRAQSRTGNRTATPATNAAASGSKSKDLDIQKAFLQLPQSFKLETPQKKARSLEAVKPPRSEQFYDNQSKEAEYEKLLDQEIRALYKLSAQQKKSAARGEIWLRLAERYIEKARLIEFREQAEYDKKLKDYLDKKSRVRPKIDMKVAREYNQKAVQLNEWFIRDFPKDAKVDQALFFLGYNHFELGNTQLGEKYYRELTVRFPNSSFVVESHFALGEFYFENEQWRQALESYAKVVRVKRARLNVFALYKASWCLYRLGKVKEALAQLDKVVRLSKAAESPDGSGRKQVNRLRLASEALRDYVPFYAEIGTHENAFGEFARVAGDEKQAIKMLEKLAYMYADAGNREAAQFTFKKLISFDPTSEKAADYQYQLVLGYATSDQKEFRKELEVWLDAFGPSSLWARENAKNQKLVTDVAVLQETTLRNHVLQLHQTAQNSRAPYSQELAHSGYNHYSKHFPNSAKIVEMTFFHAELLFDMKRYQEAALLYVWVAERDAKGPFGEKSVVNSLLALERDLPTSQEIDKKRGKSLEKMELDPPVERFEKAALRYIQTYPKGAKTSDIKRRLGVLYYSYNHFEEAIGVFEQIVKEDPKSENAEVAGNLILDIYKLRNDIAGFADRGQQFLSNAAVANTKFGVQVKGLMEKATYMKAEKIADSGDHLKAAREFETFATGYKESSLVVAARFKSAVSYEKGGDLVSAQRMHSFVLSTPSSDPKIKTVQNDSRNSLARLFQQTGQLDQAARQYMSYASANPNDQQAVNAYYNAGVLYDGLGEESEAIRAYDAYFKQSKKRDRTEVLFAQAEIHRRQGQITKASQKYDEYLMSGPRDEGHAIKSAFMIAQIASQQGKTALAKKWYQRTISLHKDAKKAGRDFGVKYAAEAKFELAQDILAQLTNVRFTANDKQQAKAAQEVVALKTKYLNEMKEVIRYDNGNFIVAALASSGRMFDQLAGQFARIPVPAGFKAEEAQQYQGLIQQQIDGFKSEAKNSYKAAVDKSHDLETYTNWAKIARSALAEQGGQTGLVDAGELTSDANAMDWMGL